MKKFWTYLFMSLSIVSSTMATSANAVTIKNGVSCSKANLTVKVGTKIYKCAKNPYVLPAKRTWTLKNCLDAYALWKSAKEEYENWKDLAKLAGPDGEKTLNELLDSISSLENTMKNVACKKGA